MISLILDASNVSAVNRTRFLFARVIAVRQAWLAHHPEGQVHAVIDASILNRLADRRLATTAEAEHWLTVAPGDADDEILGLADEYDAKIVSRDAFMWAADRYAWLHRDRDRLYEAYFRDGQAHLRRRRYVEPTPEKIAEAKRRKAQKAGVLADLDDRLWRCTSARPVDCRYAGKVVPPSEVQRLGDGYYCWSCNRPVTELVTVDAAPPAGPPTVTLLHGSLVRWERPIPPEGLRFGRAGSRHPDVLDVTEGLPRPEARAISGEHLLLKPDHTGLPVAVHLRDTNVSFVNPSIGQDGLPADNRMEPAVEYPLWPGDELLLGPGVVKLLIDGAGAAR